ncbi:hypothetical protein NFI96_017398 [Prochilodus magdalenae]|nr:hypothetical protein NFI96_017398 [Prochilodus magdalenae]
MYLCKNGVGVKMGPLEQRDEHTFILRNVSKQDSGNYSCVYSRNKYALKKVRAPAQKSIQVQVTELYQRQGQRLSVKSTTTKSPELQNPVAIPPEYSDLAEVFKKTNATKLPAN